MLDQLQQIDYTQTPASAAIEQKGLNVDTVLTTNLYHPITSPIPEPQAFQDGDLRS